MTDIRFDHLDIRFARELSKRLQEDLADQISKFSGGSWVVREDSGATAMGAMSIYAKITGINLAMRRIEETNKAMTGRIEPKKEKVE